MFISSTRQLPAGDLAMVFGSKTELSLLRRSSRPAARGLTTSAPMKRGLGSDVSGDLVAARSGADDAAERRHAGGWQCVAGAGLDLLFRRFARPRTLCQLCWAVLPKPSFRFRPTPPVPLRARLSDVPAPDMAPTHRRSTSGCASHLRMRLSPDRSALSRCRSYRDVSARLDGTTRSPARYAGDTASTPSCGSPRLGIGRWRTSRS